jgi:hypothetical protein
MLHNLAHEHNMKLKLGRIRPLYFFNIHLKFIIILNVENKIINDFLLNFTSSPYVLLLQMYHGRYDQNI